MGFVLYPEHSEKVKKVKTTLLIVYGVLLIVSVIVISYMIFH